MFISPGTSPSGRVFSYCLGAHDYHKISGIAVKKEVSERPGWLDVEREGLSRFFGV